MSLGDKSHPSLTHALRMLDNAKMRVGSFGNMNIEVVRRDEAEAILRDALRSAVLADLSHVAATGETPRTDELRRETLSDGMALSFRKAIDLARQLERELAAAKAGFNDIAKEGLKRADEADTLRSSIGPFTFKLAEAREYLSKMEAVIAATPQSAFKGWASGEDAPYALCREVEKFITSLGEINIHAPVSAIEPREMELLEHQANLVGKIARIEVQLADQTALLKSWYLRLMNPKASRQLVIDDMGAHLQRVDDDIENNRSDDGGA